MAEPLNNNDINTLNSTWSKMLLQDDAAGEYFFAKLFARAPDLKDMFQNDLQTQHRQYMNMLNVIINGLEQTDALRESLKLLGEKHTRFGATPVHFQAMADSLVETIEFFGPEDLREEEKAAWRKAFVFFSSMMLPEGN